ncbi:MAG: DNA polymerase III subunit gamma/tau [Acidimicrobiia bacterium]
MPYQALHRRYRPQRFAEIIGQEHITATLTREVIEGKVAHAYLFAGPRGTGKTTTARIIAKALNCVDRQDDGEPCNVCASCVAITDGTSLDVIELDAASHNKVEDIREIRANVATVASVGGAQRVYILDEAHMLSRAASNALLKTLEEPPEHAFFVLATTEPYKLADTIRSRAQRFDFHPVGSETIAEYLAAIAEREGFDSTSDALTLMARSAKGSVRDALGLLEQVAALGSGGVDAKGVGRALGLADREAFGRLGAAVAGQDATAALGLVAEVAAEGADLRRFVADAVGFFRGVFLAQYAPNVEEIVDEPGEIIEEWRAHARTLSPADVLRAVDRLGEALLQLREGREERLVVELALLKLTRPETAADSASLAARIDRLEERIRRLGETAVTGARSASAEQAPSAPVASMLDRIESRLAEESAGDGVPSAAKEQEEKVDDEAPSASSSLDPVEGLDLAAVESVWPALVARVRDEAGPRWHALFREAMPAGVEGSTVVLSVPAHLPFHLEQLRSDDQLGRLVMGIAAELLGGAVEVDYRAAESGQMELEASESEETEDAPKGAVDPTDLVKDILGGEVVSE